MAVTWRLFKAGCFLTAVLLSRSGLATTAVGRTIVLLPESRYIDQLAIF